MQCRIGFQPVSGSHRADFRSSDTDGGGYPHRRSPQASHSTYTPLRRYREPQPAADAAAIRTYTHISRQAGSLSYIGFRPVKSQAKKAFYGACSQRPRPRRHEQCRIGFQPVSVHTERIFDLPTLMVVVQDTASAVATSVSERSTTQTRRQAGSLSYIGFRRVKSQQKKHSMARVCSTPAPTSRSNVG